jgi:hypothetical protein
MNNRQIKKNLNESLKKNLKKSSPLKEIQGKIRTGNTDIDKEMASKSPLKSFLVYNEPKISIVTYLYMAKLKRNFR